MAKRTPEVYGHIGWRQERPAATVLAPDIDQAEQLAEASESAFVARFVYLAVALYAVTFALLSILQHQSFQTNAFDLGNMDQAVWNTANGRPFEFTNWSGGTSRLAAHVEPILFLVAPLYLVFSTPITLLILQSVVISLGAIPAFWLARETLKSGLIAAVFAFSYLLSPALEVANLADFHAVSLSSALLLFAFYYAYKQQYLGFFVAAGLAMATKEHVPVSVFLMGLYIALIQKRPRVGYAACAVAGVWAAIAFAIIIPHFNPEGVSPYMSRYDQLGASPMSIITSVLFNPLGAKDLLSEPAKIDYVVSLLSPTLWLGLLSPTTLVMALPDLAVNLLSNFQAMYAGGAHGAVIVPFVTVSAILGMGHLRQGLTRIHPDAAAWGTVAVALLILMSSLHSYFKYVFLPLTDHLPAVTEHHHMAKSLIDLIPPDAAVSASSTLNPHVSQRRQLSLFPDIDKADYIFLDVTASPYPIDAASQWYRVQQLLAGGEWGLVAARDGYLLLRRGAEARVLPEEFYTFAAAGTDPIANQLDQRFGHGLTLAGYDLEPGTKLHGNDPFARMTLYWTVNALPVPDFLLAVSVVAEEETTVLIDRHQATTVWYSPERWQLGQTVKVAVPWLPLGAHQQAEIRVKLVAREPPHAPITGLEPVIASTEAAEALREHGNSISIVTLQRD